MALLIDIAINVQESKLDDLEEYFLSSLRSFLALFGFELDFPLPAQPFTFHLPPMMTTCKDKLIFTKFSQMQSSFITFEQLVYSTLEHELDVSDERFNHIMNYIGILDECEKALENFGFNVSSIDQFNFPNYAD